MMMWVCILYDYDTMILIINSLMHLNLNLLLLFLTFRYSDSLILLRIFSWNTVIVKTKDLFFHAACINDVWIE